MISFQYSKCFKNPVSSYNSIVESFYSELNIK